MKTYISDYPLISGVKRFYNLGEQDFQNSNRVSSTKKTIVILDILHENSEGVLINNLTQRVDLVSTNEIKVHANTGEYVAYDTTTEPPTLLNADTKGEEIGQFDFFQNIKNVPIIINDLVKSVISRADAEGRLNAYVN